MLDVFGLRARSVDIFGLHNSRAFSQSTGTGHRLRVSLSLYLRLSVFGIIRSRLAMAS